MPAGSCALAENASVDHHEELLHNMKGANPVSSLETQCGGAEEVRLYKVLC